jgi:hypothetical protein
MVPIVHAFGTLDVFVSAGTFGEISKYELVISASVVICSHSYACGRQLIYLLRIVFQAPVSECSHIWR